MAPVSFVGRERESARLAELLRRARVVTVTGPGGVGKTSLAAHVARELESELAGGVRWCELAAVEPGPSVALAVAAALGAQNVAPEDAEADLAELVGESRLLLVLDNCEHVTAGAAASASRIAAAPEARVLATSRESLGLPEEHVLALEPLGLPEDDGVGTVRDSEAARLFAERAAAVRSDFEVHSENAADVARLCRRLDGLPLALELAAARARSLSPREIADRLDERFALLARRKSHAAHRHRSLRATIDWSFALLDEPEQVLFERLGVFGSAVGVDEVEEICSGAPIARADVLDLLDQLVDRSLVAPREAHGTTRYGMLETLRAYARERLSERDGLQPMRTRHADHYAALADRVRLEGLDDWASAAIVRITEVDEVLAALRWCVDSDAAPERAFRLLAPLWAVVHSHAAAEVTDLAERALARWQQRREPLAVKALGVAAVGHFVLGRPERARARALEAITAESDAAPALIARRALALVAYHFGGDLGESDRLLTEVVAVADSTGAEWVALEMSALRALVLAARGETEAGAALAAEARTKAEGGGAPHLEAWTTYVLGMIELGSGRTEAARPCFERSLELARAVDYPLIVGGGLRQLGVVAALEGDRALAAELLTASLELFRASGDRVQLWEALRSVGIALAAAREPGPAERLLDGADAAPAARPLPPLERALLERVLPDRATTPVTPEPLEELMRLASERLAGWRGAAPPAPAEPTAGIFKREGPLWTLGFAGTVVRMPHLKGLSDVATLLAHPGQEIHCLDLAADGAAVPDAALREAVGGVQGDLGELIDARARGEYRARVQELESEIDDARRAHDPVRAERAQDELTAIADELEAAYGLGGRARRAGDPAERARTAVAWRLRHALRKLEAEHAQLARHLRNAIRTGTWCVYDPEAPTRWEL